MPGQAYNPILERKPLQRFDVSSETSPTCACYSLPYPTKEVQEYTPSGLELIAQRAECYHWRQNSKRRRRGTEGWGKGITPGIRAGRHIR
jgi:hypothetical protein